MPPNSQSHPSPRPPRPTPCPSLTSPRPSLSLTRLSLSLSLRNSSRLSLYGAARFFPPLSLRAARRYEVEVVWLGGATTRGWVVKARRRVERARVAKWHEDGQLRGWAAHGGSQLSPSSFLFLSSSPHSSLPLLLRRATPGSGMEVRRRPAWR